MATIIDGKAVAAGMRRTLAAEVAELARRAIVPGLAVVLVGDDSASQVYVRSKARQTVEVGALVGTKKVGVIVSGMRPLSGSAPATLDLD